MDTLLQPLLVKKKLFIKRVNFIIHIKKGNAIEQWDINCLVSITAVTGENYKIIYMNLRDKVDYM